MKNKGFTLVELLAVIAILAILVIIALPNVLKMFNDSKKNSFLTEAKTVYSEVSKKYISESMKGNKLTHVSSEDNTKLDMTGKSLKYCVLLNADGSVKSMKVSNGEWIAELSGNKKITDLTNADLKDGNLNNYECYNPFRDDSWVTIASNAKKCVDDPDSCPYKVGDEKDVKLEKYWKHKVRIANMNTPDECKQDNFSQSACGFVIEFVDIITKHNMNPKGDYNGKTYQYGWNKDGWPKSQIKAFIDSDIYNSLPNELKSVIIDTKTVSGHGKEDTDDFTSLDKLYLLAPKEIYSNWSEQYDSARNKTRQLDYYKIKGVTTKRTASAVKNDSRWWLRSADSRTINGFYGVTSGGGYWNGTNAYYTDGISPAFRIG